jgi:DhnA family fructose-bisphosphate aldolase class Ia
MNRGGLQGASFEIDDRFTGYDTSTIGAMGLDGGKMLARIDLGDPGTVATLEAAGRAVTELALRRKIAVIEPFIVARADGGGRVVNDLSARAVVKSVAIASGLGATSAYTWLKLPVVEEMEEVMTATTLPTLLLGGDPGDLPDDTYARWAAALALPGVRGFVIGRALLYPADGDVAAAVDAACALVHGSKS